MAERAQRSLENADRSGSPRPSGDSVHAPSSRPSMHLKAMPSPTISHRPSFNEQLRGMPQSPRSSRHFSISSVGVQDLLNNPPKSGAEDPAFAGRDWRDITVGELVDSGEVRFVEIDTGIEDATNLLITSSANVLLVRLSHRETSAIGTFDYKDLNQYLLFATGSLQPDAEHRVFFDELASKAQQGRKIPVKDAKALGSKEPFVILPSTANLTEAVETFGGGVHRIVIVQEGSDKVTGILSQWNLIKFLWENGRSFQSIDQLYPQTIKDLGIGSQSVISINGDKPLKEALVLMDGEGVSSLAVVDNQQNVVGNISTVDVKLLTKSSSAPLLDNTYIHFISVILSTRGMNEGQDSVPVFHVSSYSTLAHTVAKLVATKSHRMWVVDSPSPSSSGPPTPSVPHAVVQNPYHASTAPQATPSFTPLASTPTVSASALPGVNMSGRLSGVVSLTDILNLFARASGLNPSDPAETRRHRRRSSSSSFVRGSLDSARSSSVDVSKVVR
ncbi:cell separation during budding [Lambiella insularis]|nr:cell separation during budding [Lambiella insularis]